MEKKINMSNWLTVSDYIYSTRNSEDVLKVIDLEIKGYNRPYIIKRCIGRFIKLTKREADAKYLPKK